MIVRIIKFPLYMAFGACVITVAAFYGVYEIFKPIEYGNI